MKNFYNTFLQVFLFVASLEVSAQWSPVQTGVSTTLRSVFFTDANTGYIAGNGGKILKTTDGGNSWNVAIAGNSYDLNSLHFVNPTTGFAYGGSSTGGGEVVKTIDAGATWSVAHIYDTTEVWWGVCFTDPNTGYAHGNNGLIKKSTDGGATWTALNSGTSRHLRNEIYFPTTSVGFITGDSIILKTNDAGATWLVSNSVNNLHAGLFFLDEITGYSGFFNYNGTGGVLKTSDGGTTWQTKTFANAPTDIHFPSPSIGFGVCYNGEIYKTVNAGNSWHLLNSGTSNFLRSVYFINDSVGLAVGDNGLILKTVNGGGPFVTYSISGTVYKKDSSATVNNGMVYLIEFDPSAVQLNYADSFSLSGSSGDYFFSNKQTGNYLILLRPDDVAYPNTIPTYYGDTAYWGYAEILYLLSDTAGVDIYTRQTPVWTGTGFCSGSIRYGLGSGKTGNGNVVPFGDPVPGIDISLEQIPGGIIKAHTTTNDSGFYSINNIPMNTSYKLLVDIPGLPMDSTYSIIINPSDSVITDLDFVVDTSAGTAGVYIGYPLGIKSQISNLRSQISIYPNPNNGKFEVLSSGTGSLHIEVYTTTGQLIFKSNSKNSQQVIDISNQPAGTYFLKVKSDGLLWVGKVHRE